MTQCPIAPGTTYVYNFTTQGQEGTLWWHAHISWLRAIVYGALVIYPRIGRPYPFHKPSAEVPNEAIRSGGGGVANESDAFTINSQPGDLLPCSEKVYRIDYSSDLILICLLGRKTMFTISFYIFNIFLIHLCLN